LFLFGGAFGQHDDDFGPPDVAAPVAAAAEETSTIALNEFNGPLLPFHTLAPEPDSTPIPPLSISTTT